MNVFYSSYPSYGGNAAAALHFAERAKTNNEDVIVCWESENVQYLMSHLCAGSAVAGGTVWDPASKWTKHDFDTVHRVAFGAAGKNRWTTFKESGTTWASPQDSGGARLDAVAPDYNSRQVQPTATPQQIADDAASYAAAAKAVAAQVPPSARDPAPSLTDAIAAAFQSAVAWTNAAIATVKVFMGAAPEHVY